MKRNIRFAKSTKCRSELLHPSIYTGPNYLHARSSCGYFAAAFTIDPVVKEIRMGQQIKHLMDEADIGGGEKTPGQGDVKSDQRSVPQGSGNESGAPGRILQSGTHLARILALAQLDGTYEAQVFVRLTREPEIAETYIPTGTYPTEAEAWAAAEERVQRAFTEHEF